MACAARRADVRDHRFKLGRVGRAAVRPDVELRQFAVEQARDMAADRVGVIKDDAAVHGFQPVNLAHQPFVIRPVIAMQARSEEHTSELQSLMRISYAVFCLKKKKTKDKHELATT